MTSWEAKKLTESSVIIVGNSPRILEYKCGELIDSFDIVIRINRCVTSGFEKYIGSKTDIWATTKNYQSQKGKKYGYKTTFIPENYYNIKEIWKRAAKTELQSLPLGTCSNCGNILGNIPTYVMYKNNDFKYNIQNKLSHWNDTFNFRVNHKDPQRRWKCENLRGHEPDTGILTIMTADLFYSDITLYGFDFYSESDIIQCYYRESELNSDGTHHEDPWWESQKTTGFAHPQNTKTKNNYIQKLIDDGKFKLLNHCKAFKKIKNLK